MFRRVTLLGVVWFHQVHLFSKSPWLYKLSDNEINMFHLSFELLKYFEYLKQTYCGTYSTWMISGGPWWFCLRVTRGVVSHSTNKRVRLRELSLYIGTKPRIQCNQLGQCAHCFWQSTLVLHLHLSMLLVKDQCYTRFEMYCVGGSGSLDNW